MAFAILPKHKKKERRDKYLGFACEVNVIEQERDGDNYKWKARKVPQMLGNGTGRTDNKRR